ncbi:hypothetical protein MMAD_55190 (plasmid) [Mycolicibacterium madagascariense]|uniref:Htaa domain-containing protein n=1 Tax=Mycolicibacterium madagascariense TaxID=212765 RepID=A0A7I7XQ09_9MYCO|nr:HtaA domain-containing protein [Mycolicibacterium madagascariense]BBZ31224.1 hypothetical protein MMAD_55190 [Mycolicibacterium madagascariense]
MSPAAPAAPDASLVGLRWAIKHSFLDYVAKTPDGRAYVDQGASVTASNDLVFPPRQARLKGAAGGVDTYEFGGEVHFVAYGGMLYVRIGDPVIHVCGGAGRLTVRSVDDADRSIRVELATFTVGDTGSGVAGPTQWHATDVRLAAEGVPVFADVYSTGEPLAPLQVRLPDAQACG